MAETESEEAWEAGWEGHKEAQRLHLARLPLAEKLRWLEEAHELVSHLRRSAEARAARGVTWKRDEPCP